MLIGAVVVAAAYDHDGKAIGVGKSHGVVLGCGLARAVGVARSKGAVLVKGGACRSIARPVDFIAAHLQEDVVAKAAVRLFPVAACGIHQGQDALGVGLVEGVWVFYGAIYVALSGKVDDVVGTVLAKDGIECGLVADIGMDKDMALITCQIGDVFQVACVGERINVDDSDVVVAP